VPTKKKVGINTAFLRSGGEFRVATNVSPKIQRFEGMRTRGRDVRANAFAAKMLAGKLPALSPISDVFPLF